MGSPNILFDVEAHQFYSTYNLEDERQKKSAFYRCKDANNSIIGYLTRDDAIEKEEFEDIEKMNKILDLVDTNSKDDILTYVIDRPGSTGLWNSEGDIVDKSVVKEYRNKLRETQSTIWSCAISFRPEYGAENCANKVEAQKMVSSTINKFFKKAKLDPNNMEWIGAYHVNTKNPHCHVLFWEDKPNKLNAKGELTFAKWKLPAKALEEYPVYIQQYFDKQKTSTIEGLKLRDENRKALRYNLRRKDLQFEFQTLSEQLEDIEAYQYNRISKENQKIINDFVDKIIETNPELKANDQSYRDTLVKQQQSLIKSFEENHVEVNQKVLNYTSDRIQEYYSRLGNETLQALKYYRRIQLELEEAKTHSASERKELDNLQQKLITSFSPNNIKNLDTATCIRQLQKKGYIVDEEREVPTIDKNSLIEENIKNKKELKEFDPRNLKPFDRKILNEYGIDFIQKDTKFKLIPDGNGYKKYHGPHTKFTFINASGTTKDYFLLNDKGLQNSFPNVLKSLGLNNKDILNIINKCDHNNLLPKLILNTGHYDLNWFAHRLFANPTEKSYYQKKSFNENKFFGQDRKQLYTNKQLKTFFNVQIDQNFLFLLNSINEEQENKISILQKTLLHREGDEDENEKDK